MDSYTGGHNASRRQTNREKNNHEEPKKEVPPWNSQQLNYWGLQLVCGRPALALSSALVPQTLSSSVCLADF